MRVTIFEHHIKQDKIIYCKMSKVKNNMHRVYIEHIHVDYMTLYACHL